MGIVVVGSVQLVALVVIGLVAASVAGSVELPPGTPRVALEVVAWFVLGFALYSCLFAVGGALAGRAEEVQNTTGSVSLVAVASLVAIVWPAARVSAGGALHVGPRGPAVLDLCVHGWWVEHHLCTQRGWTDPAPESGLVG